MADTHGLKLFAEDEADLKVISAALQDGVTKAGALRYQAKKRRFSIELNRYAGKKRPRAGPALSLLSIACWALRHAG